MYKQSIYCHSLALLSLIVRLWLIVSALDGFGLARASSLATVLSHDASPFCVSKLALTWPQSPVHLLHNKRGNDNYERNDGNAGILRVSARVPREPDGGQTSVECEGGWVWQNVACVDSDRDYMTHASGQVARRTNNYSKGRPFRARAGLSCFDGHAGSRTPRCFRFVLDSFVTRREILELSLATRPQNFPPHNNTVWKRLMHRVTGLLDDLFETGPLHHVASYHIATLYGPDWPSLSGDNLTAATADPTLSDNSVWPGLHTDFLSSPSNEEWVYTCLIYLSDSLADVVGGETGIADNFDPEGRTTEGLVVEPVPGRLFCFSSGAENFHGRRPILYGDRFFIQVMFDCGAPVDA